MLKIMFKILSKHVFLYTYMLKCVIFNLKKKPRLILFFLAIRCCLYEISRIGKFIQKHTNGGQGLVGGERPDILIR